MALSESPAIEDLRLLLAIAETGNVTQAAKLFGVSQPSITKRLKVFQGKNALLTSDGTVALTDSGRRVLPAVRELVRHYDQLKSFMKQQVAAPEAICIATGSSASQFFLPAAIAAMRAQVPELEIQVQAIRGKERLSGVFAGTFDLVIVSHDCLQINLARSAEHRVQPKLVVEELARQTLCVVALRGTPEADVLSTTLAGQEFPLSKLCELALIGLDGASGVRRQLERSFASQSTKLSFGPNAAGWLGVKEYARQGLGTGILPLALLSREDTEAFVIRRLSSEVTVNHNLLHREDIDHRHFAALKAAIVSAARQHQDEVTRRWRGLI